MKLLHNYQNTQYLLSLYNHLKKLNKHTNKTIQKNIKYQKLTNITKLFSTKIIFSKNHFQ